MLGDDELVRFYTGLPGAEAFNALFESIYHYIEGGLVRHHGALREDGKKLNVDMVKGAALLNTRGQRHFSQKINSS